MGPVKTRALCAVLLFCLAGTTTFVSADDGKTTKAPANCRAPQCANKDCRTKVGNDGCLECDCRPADCPLLVCGPGCHEETNATAHRCPECVCNGDKGKDRPCPEVTCPPECEKETVKPTHRCPWCLCPAITAKMTLLKYGERHCPHALLEMVFRQADPLALHVHHLQEQVRHQDGAVQHLASTSGTAGERPARPECVPPKCDGKGCQLVPGDQGCPRCVCTPEPTSKKKGNRTKAGKAVTKRNTGARKESSEESNESNSKESKETTTSRRARRDDHKAGRREARKQDKQVNQTATANRTEPVQPRQQLPPPPPVQCVTPVCEPYCKYRQAEHGCLVCECPDVCPDMVCGAGCQPYFTDASKCQRCLCAPHSRREELAEVFAGFCKEHTLHRMVADFDDFRDVLLRLHHRSLELQELIGRAEHARGIHGPVPEEMRASFGRHHHNHHPPLHHQGAHHQKHGQHHQAKPAERQPN